MSILHTVNKSPFQQTTLEQCLEVIGTQHSLLLIEDGVYAALSSNPQKKKLTELTDQGLKLYALDTDLQARGLTDKLIDKLHIISMTDFVELCCQHQNCQSWY